MSNEIIQRCKTLLSLLSLSEFEKPESWGKNIEGNS